MQDTISIWLDVDIKTLSQRVGWNQNRPLLEKEKNYKKLNELYTQRKNIYKLADYKIVCNNLNKEDIVERIIELYEKY